MTDMSKNYGYNGSLELIRSKYKQMPHAYLDNAAAPLVLSSIPYRMADLLSSTTIVNPHSGGTLGTSTSRLVDDTRNEILRLFNADPANYELVFCSNTTSAVKLVGEAIHGSHYAYSVDSHTSLVGLRDLAESFSTFAANPEDEALFDLNICSNALVSWPLQSNFDGTRYPGKPWVEYIHQKGGMVLLDVASYATTEFPDLSSMEPDFTVFSFYKIFGFPDLGALIVRKTPKTVEFLKRKRYFGGGTVASLAPTQNWMMRPTEKISTWLEDGTLPIHTILGLKAAILEFKDVFGEDFSNKIKLHTNAVATYCRERLSGVAGCKLIGEGSESPIVTFQLESIGHNEFAEAASLAGIYIRSGTLCNVGAFTCRSQFTDSKIIANFTKLGKKCNDEISFINSEPTGVIRASLGPYSSYADVDALLGLVRQFEKTTVRRDIVNEKALNPPESKVTIDQMYIYPIKSCCGMRVKESILTISGLKYDRAFCLVELSSKKILTLKKHRSMAFLKPFVERNWLVVNYESPNDEHSRTLQIPFHSESWSSAVCHEKLVVNFESSVVEFFSQALGFPCTIAKNLGEAESSSRNLGELEQRQQSTFANSSPLLVTTTASGESLEVPDPLVFRPNIIIKTQVPWSEDIWEKLVLCPSKEHSLYTPGGRSSDPQIEILMLGPCRRCNMVCVTSKGTTDSFPYMQLCKHRKNSGKIYFGQHATLGSSSDDIIVREGASLIPAIRD